MYTNSCLKSSSIMCSCPHAWKPVFKQSIAWPGKKHHLPICNTLCIPFPTRWERGRLGREWHLGYTLPGCVLESGEFWCSIWATPSQVLVPTIFCQIPSWYKGIRREGEKALGCAHHAGLSLRTTLNSMSWLAELVRARNYIQCIATGTAPSSSNITEAHSKLVIIQSPP